MSAFKDFTPGQGGGSSAPAAAASDEPADEPVSDEPAEEEEGEEDVAESSGGGGDYPPHAVMGLPALSPTMSQGDHTPLVQVENPLQGMSSHRRLLTVFS